MAVGEVMRPIYETQTDRNNEQRVARQLAALWDRSIVKLKMACVIDFAIFRDGKMVGVMEVKCRNYSSEAMDNMGGVMLSAHKAQAGMTWAMMHNIAFAFAVELTDGIFVLFLTEHDDLSEFNLEIMGRKDRGDAQDMEPCIVIPMKRFKKYAEAVSTGSA